MQNIPQSRPSSVRQAVICISTILSCPRQGASSAAQVTTSAIPTKDCSAAYFSMITPEVSHSFLNKVPLLEPRTESLPACPLPCHQHTVRSTDFHWSLLPSYCIKNSSLICMALHVPYFLDSKGWYGEQVLAEMGFYKKVGSAIRTAGNISAVFQETRREAPFKLIYRPWQGTPQDGTTECFIQISLSV